MTDLYPLKLPPSFREKIWGRRDLSPLFRQQPRPVGEAWYTFEENTIANGQFRGCTLAELMEHLGPRLMGSSYAQSHLHRRSAGDAATHRPEGSPCYFPILSKLLFTSDRLSVQVHPDDDYGFAHEDAPGKAEVWYVVGAERDAAVAIGLTRRMEPQEMARAAQTGEIAEYLNWVRVEPGQTLFVSPGTLHSIGPGLILCEIQQNSDLTYRFFDFGRLEAGKPRALHIEQAVAVTRQEPFPGPTPPFRLPGGECSRELLAACRHFAAERLVCREPLEYRPDPERMHLMILLEGEGRLGAEPYRAGEAFLIPAEAPPFRLEPAQPTVAIRGYVPDLQRLRSELYQAGAAENHVEKLLIE